MYSKEQTVEILFGQIESNRPSRKDRLSQNLDIYQKVMSDKLFSNFLVFLNSRTSNQDPRYYNFFIEGMNEGEFEKIESSSHYKIKEPSPNRLHDYPIIETRLDYKSEEDYEMASLLFWELREKGHIAFSQGRSSILPYWVSREMIAQKKLTVPDDDFTIVDLCGAPGNKTLNAIHLAPPETKVVGIINDYSKKRTKRVEDRLLRDFSFDYDHQTGKYTRSLQNGTLVTLYVTNFDATNTGETKTHLEYLLGKPAADLVITDVPCVGDGRIAINPNEAVQLQTSDNQRKQVEIVKVGLEICNDETGFLSYSTCSVNTKSNEQVINQVGPDFVVDTHDFVDHEFLYPSVLTDSNDKNLGLRAYPENMDVGFFVSLLKKN